MACITDNGYQCQACIHNKYINTTVQQIKSFFLQNSTNQQFDAGWSDKMEEEEGNDSKHEDRFNRKTSGALFSLSEIRN